MCQEKKCTVTGTLKRNLKSLPDADWLGSLTIFGWNPNKINTKIAKTTPIFHSFENEQLQHWIDIFDKKFSEHISINVVCEQLENIFPPITSKNFQIFLWLMHKKNRNIALDFWIFLFTFSMSCKLIHRGRFSCTPKKTGKKIFPIPMISVKIFQINCCTTTTYW